MPRRPVPPEEHLAVRREILDGPGIARALRRIAHEIVERNSGTADVVLVGIRTGGVYLAERLRALLGEIEGRAPACGIVDITLYRDDVFRGLPRPEVGPTDLPFPIEDKVVVLVDDVLYTGRTVRAALDGLVDFGRPRLIQLGVLVDRGHRELPIHADYVGKTLSTTPEEFVQVKLKEEDGIDAVLVGSIPKPRRKPTKK